VRLTDFITRTGTYTLNVTSFGLAEPVSILTNFSVAKISVNIENEKVKTGKKAKFSVNIDSPEKVVMYGIEFGDGNSFVNSSVNKDYVSDYVEHAYLTEGKYKVKLTTAIKDKIFVKEKNGVEVMNETERDNTTPKIVLLYPLNNERISKNDITFSFRAEDDTKIKNCTFELYNYSNNWGVLDYTETRSNIENSQLVEIRLINFVEGDYSWNVVCCDNSSNCNADLEYDADFKIVFLNDSISSNELLSAKFEEEKLDHGNEQDIKDLILRRDRIKGIIEKEGKNPVLTARSYGLKTILNSCYGYFGYFSRHRNPRVPKTCPPFTSLRNLPGFRQDHLVRTGLLRGK